MGMPMFGGMAGGLLLGSAMSEFNRQYCQLSANGQLAASVVVALAETAEVEVVMVEVACRFFVLDALQLTMAFDRHVISLSSQSASCTSLNLS